jgi:hypothetical protein
VRKKGPQPGCGYVKVQGVSDRSRGSAASASVL